MICNVPNMSFQNSSVGTFITGMLVFGRWSDQACRLLMTGITVFRSIGETIDLTSTCEDEVPSVKREVVPHHT